MFASLQHGGLRSLRPSGGFPFPVGACPQRPAFGRLFSNAPAHGEKAHSCYFSKDAFAKLTGDNKELLLIPGASHTDLYDRRDVIPFDRIATFFLQYLQ